MRLLSCYYLFNLFTDSENVLNGNAMTASSKISAINLVAELLRKVNVSFSSFYLGLNVVYKLNNGLQFSRSKNRNITTK